MKYDIDEIIFTAVSVGTNIQLAVSYITLAAPWKQKSSLACKSLKTQQDFRMNLFVWSLSVKGMLLTVSVS